MALEQNRNSNRNDTAVMSEGIELNQSTAVKIADANPERTFFHVGLDCDVADVCVRIRLQAADVEEDVVKGIKVQRYNLGNDVIIENPYTMTPDNMYTGEISAIIDDGATNVDVYVTEY